MYQHIITRMVSELVDGGVVSEQRRGRAEEKLKDFWKHQIPGGIWNVEDVKRSASENGLEISHEEALDILSAVFYSLDCNVGVNWGVIEAAVTNHCNERDANVSPV